jgi:hypothetical protein
VDPRTRADSQKVGVVKFLWGKLKLLLVDPAIRELSPDKQAERMEPRVMRLVLSLYNAGYDPAVIARALVAHATAFVVECGGPEMNYAELLKAEAVLEDMLQAEYYRRQLSPPYDRVAQFVRRRE